MKTAPFAAACCLVLAQVFSGCSETSSPPGSELAFDCLEIDGVTTDHASTGCASWVDFDGDGDLAPHFGLGTHETADRVEVKWPSGRVTVQENVAADQVVEIRKEAITP